MNPDIAPLHAPPALDVAHERRSSPGESLDLELARAHVARLIEIYRDGLALMHRAMFAQSSSMPLEMLAQRTVAHATELGSEEAIGRAMAATGAASRALDPEDRCTETLARHRAHAVIT